MWRECIPALLVGCIGWCAAVEFASITINEGTGNLVVNAPVSATTNHTTHSLSHIEGLKQYTAGTEITVVHPVVVVAGAERHTARPCWWGSVAY
jgi:hypothetical protein